MPESDSNRDRGTLLGNLRRAFEHAEQAAKCYAALIASKAEQWGRRSFRYAIGVVLLTVFVVTGIVFILSGLALLVQGWFGKSFPGGGFICVGIGIIILSLLLILAARKKGEN